MVTPQEHPCHFNISIACLYVLELLCHLNILLMRITRVTYIPHLGIQWSNFIFILYLIHYARKLTCMIVQRGHMLHSAWEQADTRSHTPRLT